MNIAVMRETHPGETRAPMVPATVERLAKLGAEVVVESGLGLTCRFEDASYAAAGALSRKIERTSGGAARNSTISDCTTSTMSMGVPVCDCMR